MADFPCSAVLHRQEVVVAGLIIHPVVRRDHRVRIQRGDDVVDNVLLRQAQFARVHAIDIQTNRWIVHVLRNIDLAHAWKFSNAACQILSDVVSGSQIAGVHLNVDRSRHAGIENRVHHGPALEEGANIGEIGG